LLQVHRITLAGTACVFLGLGGYSLWLHSQKPENAKTDPWQVWINVLKGFGTDVVYVGSEEPFAYFRIGTLFPHYYKMPSCNASLPQTFALGAGETYVVVLDHLRGPNLNCEAPPTKPAEESEECGDK
jgi:hypothetical protein